MEFGWCLENDLRTDLVGEINNSRDLMEACLYLGKNGFEGYYGKAEKMFAQSYFARSAFGCQLPYG